MFTKIRGELRFCLAQERIIYAVELKRIYPPRLREAIEIGLRCHLKAWLEELVKERMTKLLPDLLNNLLLDRDRLQNQYPQKISKKNPTLLRKYEEILTAAFQNLRSTASFEKLKQVQENLSLVQNTHRLVAEHLPQVLAECPLYQNLESKRREKWDPFLAKNLVCLIVLNLVPGEIIPVDYLVSCEDALCLLIPKMYAGVFPGEPPQRLVQEPYLGLLQYLFPGNDQGDERAMHLKKVYKTCLYCLLKGIGINVTGGGRDTQTFTNWLENHFRNVFTRLRDSLLLEENWFPIVHRHLETQKSRLALARQLQLAIPPDLLREVLHSNSTHEETS